MSPPYKDYGDRAHLLWMVSMKRICEINGVVDCVGETTWLVCPGKHGGEVAVLFGGACVTADHCAALAGVERALWVRFASMTLRLRRGSSEQLFAAVHTILQRERDLAGSALRYCYMRVTRANLAAALRGYRRRRAELLAMLKDGA